MADHPRTHSFVAILSLMGALFLFVGCQDQNRGDSETQSDSNSEISDTREDDSSENIIPPFTRTSMSLPLPDFELERMTGGKLTAEDLKGRVSIINFWATWCGPCIIEIPHFVVLFDEWQHREFDIIGVSMDDEGFDLVRPFAEDFAINYPVVIDHGELADAFGGVYGLPTTFIVDENGIIVERFVGLFPIDAVKDELDEMLQRIE